MNGLMLLYLVTVRISRYSETHGFRCTTKNALTMTPSETVKTFQLIRIHDLK